MFGLGGQPTLPDGEWLLHMLALFGILALLLYSRRGTRAERTERFARHRSISSRLAIAAVVAFALWFAAVFVMAAGPVAQAFLTD